MYTEAKRPPPVAHSHSAARQGLVLKAWPLLTPTRAKSDGTTGKSAGHWGHEMSRPWAPGGYVPKSKVAAMVTTGARRGVLPSEPANGASPKVKMPPSEATSQYPFPLGVAAICTIGWLSRIPPVEP